MRFVRTKEHRNIKNSNRKAGQLEQTRLGHNKPRKQQSIRTDTILEN